MSGRCLSTLCLLFVFFPRFNLRKRSKKFLQLCNKFFLLQGNISYSRNPLCSHTLRILSVSFGSILVSARSLLYLMYVAGSTQCPLQSSVRPMVCDILVLFPPSLRKIPVAIALLSRPSRVASESYSAVPKSALGMTLAAAICSFA